MKSKNPVSFDINKVVRLANLPLSDKELEKYNSQLSSVLEYVDKLGELETGEVEPTFNTTDKSRSRQKDEVGTCLSREEALSNAPSTKNGFFVTKGIFENE